MNCERTTMDRIFRYCFYLILQMIILSLIGIDSPKILEIIQLQILTFILVELRIISEKINRENEK